jgi:hypothetical protein
LIPSYAGGVLPSPAGLSAMLVTKPDLIPESLTTALGCSTATDPVVKNVCSQAVHFGGKYLDVYALAQSAGQITNFGVLTWTQRIKFKLINPLLGSNCYIGSDNNPIVIKPELSVALAACCRCCPTRTRPSTLTLRSLRSRGPRPSTTRSPRRYRLRPGWREEHPGRLGARCRHRPARGVGVNSLTLTGSFGIAATTAGEDISGANNAKILLSALTASSKTAGSRAAVRRISGAQLHHVLRSIGIRSR